MQQDRALQDSWFVLAGSQATVVLEGALGASLHDAVQSAIEGPEPVVSFLSAITANGVRDLPSFAYVGRESGDARIILRGGIEAVERTAEGTDAAHAAGSVSTWTEIVRSDVRDIALRSPDGSTVAVVTFGPPPERGGPPAGAGPEPVVVAAVAPGADEQGPSGSARVEETVLPGPDLDAASPLTIGPVDAPTAGVPVLEPPADDEVDLSHLFETRHVGVEAAAMRDDPAPRPDPGLPAPAGDAAESPSPGPSLPPPSGPSVSLPPPSGPPVPLPPPAGLIAGVPGSMPPPAVPLDAGDHDGMTISAAALAELRTEAAVPPAAPSTVSVGPQLQAVACPSGHLNAPQSERCRACGAGILDRTIRLVARPTLGHLTFDNGVVADIDRPLLIGRKPTVEGIGPGAEVPSLVVLPDPDGSLSRIHAEVRLEGWEVLVVDRGSTNGTRVTIPGRPPVLLRPDEPMLISPGTAITLADVVTCTYDTGPR